MGYKLVIQAMIYNARTLPKGNIYPSIHY